MKQIIQKGICFIFLLFVSVPALAVLVPITAVVDGINIGDISTNIDKNSKAESIRADELVNLLKKYLQADKIERIKSLANEEGYLTLVQLERVGITPKFNEKELKLVLEIPLDMRVVKDFPVLIQKQKAGLAVQDGDYSGYLNLRGLVGYSERTDPTSYTYTQNPSEGQFELVQNLKYFTVESTAVYREFEENPFQRVDSSLVHDYEKRQVRFRLGDFNPRVQGFQSSLQAAGLQIQKEFNINPNRGSLNKRSTVVQVKNNSILEVYVNSNLISRLRVSAGPYNLKELPLLFGRNKVKIILKDDFGGVEEFEVDLLFDDQILAQGVHDFSYQAGQPSFFTGLEKEYVNDILSSFYHKYGLTDELTLFTNYQNYRSTNLYGLGLGVLTGHGTHFFDTGHYSDETTTASWANRWRYNSADLSVFSFDRFRIFAGAEFRNKDFNTVTIGTPAVPNFDERYDLILQKQLTDRSSFGVGLARTHGQGFGQNDLTRRATYQTLFAADWRFDASYSWSERDPDFDQLQLTLSWFEPQGKAQAAFSHDNLDNNTTVRVTKNRQSDFNDLQLDAIASKRKARSTDVETQNLGVSANYYASKFETRLQVNGSSSLSELSTVGQLGLGTALAWTPDSISLSRPITDSFAVIEAQGLSRNQFITVPLGTERDRLKITNNENFVFSNLSSYVDRPLQLDSTSLGSSKSLEREAYILSPKYRTGVFVPLKIKESIIVRGRLTAQQASAASYAYGKILTADGQVFSNNFFTDESGNFVLDGLSYGQYQIVLSDPRLKRINFLIEQPDGSDEDDEDSQSTDATEFELGTLKIEKATGM